MDLLKKWGNSFRDQKKRPTFELNNKQKEGAMNYNLIAAKLHGKSIRFSVELSKNLDQCYLNAKQYFSS